MYNNLRICLCVCSWCVNIYLLVLFVYLFIVVVKIEHRPLHQAISCLFLIFFEKASYEIIILHRLGSNDPPALTFQNMRLQSYAIVAVNTFKSQVFFIIT